ncbi:MAG: hypothetical protein K2N51_11745 [Lachnospiraceae bacterium]|nr:hypothetical protein [Lachnospiraceae bacterium]
MNEEVQYGVILTPLLILVTVSPVPLVVFLGYYGLIAFGILFVVAMYFAVKIEKYKKNNNIQTYREIMAFVEGKRLDEIEKAKEYGKRPYQKVLSALIGGIVAFFISVMFMWLLERF